MDYSALLYQTGDALGAAAQIRQVLAVNPDLPDALNNLAWLLATSANDAARDGAQAVHHAERACQFTGFKQSRMLGTLAAAYAEAGRFPEAIATAEKALQLETAGGETAFAGSIRYLLQNYRAGKCWHEVSTAPKPERSL
jgi:Flp pilus assembly protein TadD